MSFWQFFRNRLIGWIGHAPLVQPSKTAHRIFFLFYIDILILINIFTYETIVRSSVWSFGHSDPDLSSVVHVLLFGFRNLKLSKYCEIIRFLVHEIIVVSSLLLWSVLKLVELIWTRWCVRGQEHCPLNLSG